ncbi:MAG: hypothetical protein JXX29_18075 [Deltaproteobacteria bacterium]|nr:hypothetical protein [Deltaproteobacteria bacterium]MBN2673595.1 hypothetical protein [Deltaproteobacteria bacterium]
MIYCPKCKKPSAKNSGNCPHCGTSLDGSSPSAAKGRVNLSGPTLPQGHEELRYGGADIDMDIGAETDDLPLELDTGDIAPPASYPPAATPQSRQSTARRQPGPARVAAASVAAAPPGSSMAEVDEAAKVADIAQFGKVETGVLGIMKYGLRVKQRLPVLAAENETTQSEKKIAWDALEAAKAALGRAAHREKIADKADDPKLARIVANAQKADGRLEEVQREEDKINLEFEKKYQVVDSARAEVEAAMEPFKIEELKTQTAFEQIKKEKGRLTAKVKRTEIELRNIRELIEKKQTAYADLQRPKEERSRLLKEIAEQDNKQVPLQNRLKTEQQELDAIRAPFDAIQHKLQSVQQNLGGYNEKLVALNKQHRDLEKEQENALNGVHSKAEGESKHAQEAWASVGEIVYVNKLIQGDAMSAAANTLNTKTNAFFAAQEKAALYEQALTSYNKGAFEQAKKYWMVAAALAAILIIILIAAAIF